MSKESEPQVAERRQRHPVEVPTFSEIALEQPPERIPFGQRGSPWDNVVRHILGRETNEWLRIKIYRNRGEANRARQALKSASRRVAGIEFDLVVRESTLYGRRGQPSTQ